MFEYVFFDDRLCERFLAALEAESVAFERLAGESGYSLYLDDDRLERLETLYDGLLDEQRALATAEEGDGEDVVHRVGVH